MKKRIFVLVLGVSISLFYCGFCIGIIEGKGQVEKGFFPQSVNRQKIKEGERYLVFMEEKKKEFLEDHLYGQWRFLEKVASGYDEEYGLTEIGERELKRMVILEYQKEFVRHPLKDGQASFTNPKDMWTFGICGGLSWGKQPVYTMEKMKESWIVLGNLREKSKIYHARVPGAKVENFIHIKYGFQTSQEEWKDSDYQEDYFGSNIYVDPDDTESIYVEFCGLWKMVRTGERDGEGY